MNSPLRLVLALVLLIATARSAAAQSGWTWQNPLPQGNSLKDVWFVSSSEGWAVGDHGTIIHTSDGGASWEIQESATAEPLYGVCFADASTGWAVGYNGVILSTSNGGELWTAQSSGTTDFLRDVFFLTASEGWAVGITMRVLHTTDGGQQWMTLKSGGTDHLFSVVFVNSQEGWACGATGSYGIVYHTTDGGTLWQRQVIPTARMNALSFSSALEGWVAGDGGMIFRTTDGGANWARQDASTLENLRGVWSLNGSTALIVGESGKILRTSNGGAGWESPTSPTPAILASVHLPTPTDGWAVGNGGTIVRTTDGGATWKMASTGGIEHLLAAKFLDQTRGWAVGNDGAMIQTTNGGSSWSALPTGSPVRNLYDLWFCDDQMGWIVGDWGAVRLTTDAGATWQEQTITGHVASAGIRAIHVMEQPTGGRRAWIGCDLGFFYRTDSDGASWQPLQTTCGNTIYSTHFVSSDIGWAVGMPRSDNPGTITYTTDGGETWLAQTNPRGAIALRAVDFVDPLHGCAVGLSGTILTTDDGGTTWTARTGYTFKRLNSVRLRPGGQAWAVGEEGTILHSTDFGVTWESLASPTVNELEDIVFVDDQNGWIVGWNGTVLHTSDAGGVVSVDADRQELPGTPRLEQNYPNPFNPTTTIAYVLPASGMVSLRVFNALGQEVAVLVSETLPAGRHTARWDAGALPSGVYFCRLAVGRHLQIRKAILVR